MSRIISLLEKKSRVRQSKPVQISRSRRGAAVACEIVGATIVAKNAVRFGWFGHSDNSNSAMRVLGIDGYADYKAVASQWSSL